MIKTVLLLRRKPGMTMEEFIDYYENNHAPLCMELYPGLFADYRRSYILPDGMYSAAHVGAAAPVPEFDVISELWFRTQEDYERMQAGFADPQIGPRLRADEMNLFDTRPEAMILMRVEEHLSCPIDA